MGGGWAQVLAAVLIGALLALQAGINSQLRRWVGDPVQTALVSFAVGAVALLAYSLVLRNPWPRPSALAGSPWWVWIGGLLGAVYVASVVVLVPRLGTALLLALVVVGQMLASLLVDHFGLVGVPQHPITATRVLGAALLVAGVVLIRR